MHGYKLEARGESVESWRQHAFGGLNGRVKLPAFEIRPTQARLSVCLLLNGTSTLLSLLGRLIGLSSISNAKFVHRQSELIMHTLEKGFIGLRCVTLRTVSKIIVIPRYWSVGFYCILYLYSTNYSSSSETFP